MPWDTRRIYERVSEDAVPMVLLDWLRQNAKAGQPITLCYEKDAPPGKGGKRPAPVVGAYTPEPDEEPPEIASVISGMALSLVDDQRVKTTGKFRVRTRTGTDRRSSKDFHADDIQRDEDDESDGDGASPNDCPACAMTRELLTAVQADNQHLREQLSEAYRAGMDRFDSYVSRAEQRFDATLERTDNRLERERDKRDAVVDRQIQMAEQVISPSNDATARTLGILGKGVELVEAGLQTLQDSAKATADERRDAERRQLARDVMEQVAAIAGPLVAKKMGIEPGNLQAMTTPNETAKKLAEITPYEGLVQVRNEIFEMAADDHWSKAAEILGDDVVESILSLRDQDPLMVADVQAACASVAAAGKSALLQLAVALPGPLSNHLLLLDEIAKEAVQP